MGHRFDASDTGIFLQSTNSCSFHLYLDVRTALQVVLTCLIILHLQSASFTLLTPPSFQAVVPDQSSLFPVHISTMHALQTAVVALGLCLTQAHALPASDASLVAHQASNSCSSQNSINGAPSAVTTVDLTFTSSQSPQQYGIVTDGCPAGFSNELSASCSAYSLQALDCELQSSGSYHATFTLLAYTTGVYPSASCVDSVVQSFSGQGVSC